MTTIKRIHVHIGRKHTTISMDPTLFAYLEQRLSDNHLSVRQWVQDRVDKMLSDGVIHEADRSASVSRRVQAAAIHLIASPRPSP
jgi:tRNA A37 N6-isopentenylltransferase MiaA